MTNSLPVSPIVPPHALYPGPLLWEDWQAKIHRGPLLQVAVQPVKLTVTKALLSCTLDLEVSWAPIPDTYSIHTPEAASGEKVTSVDWWVIIIAVFKVTALLRIVTPPVGSGVSVTWVDSSEQILGLTPA
jgi:hypothetical protein